MTTCVCGLSEPHEPRMIVVPVAVGKHTIQENRWCPGIADTPPSVDESEGLIRRPLDFNFTQEEADEFMARYGPAAPNEPKRCEHGKTEAHNFDDPSVDSGYLYCHGPAPDEPKPCRVHALNDDGACSDCDYVEPKRCCQEAYDRGYRDCERGEPYRGPASDGEGAQTFDALADAVGDIAARVSTGCAKHSDAPTLREAAAALRVLALFGGKDTKETDR